MDKLVATLLIWIGTHSNYDTSNIVQPEIVLLSPQELTSEYYEGSGVALPDSGIDARVYALYQFADAPQGVIYLIDPRRSTATAAVQIGDKDETFGPTVTLESEWLDDPVFQEQLLHELVHHVQYQSGAASRFPCPAFGEKEAYLLGGKFLALRFANDPLPNRNVLAHIYSRC